MIGGNLYYTNELIQEKSHNRKAVILKYYRTISDYLKTKYPSLSFCITNLNYASFDDEYDTIIFVLNQLMDGAIIDQAIFSLNIENGKIVEYDDDDSNSNFFILEPDKAVNLMDANQAINTAIALFQSNADQIFTSIDTSRTRSGECYLKYDGEKFYYTIVLNGGGSFVNVDAVTGEVIESFFFNGIFYLD